VHATKAYGRGGGGGGGAAERLELHSFIISAPDVGEPLASHHGYI